MPLTGGRTATPANLPLCKAVGGLQRGTAETPARTCAGPGGGGFQQQDGFQLAIVLVQDRQHLCVVALGGLRLRLRAAAGTGQGEQGNSNGQSDDMRIGV
jgi:hypothetical protein